MADSIQETIMDDNINDRISKIEAQIGRVLIHLKIARPDEIIVTKEMPLQLPNVLQGG